MRTFFEKLACLIQSIVPQRGLTALVYRFMRIETVWFKNLQIRLISRLVGVNWDEAASTRLEDYPTFNAFFTRELKSGMRNFTAQEDALCCPVDGRVSELGNIRGDRIYQAKGRDFTLRSLLAEEDDWQQWQDGHFITVYLSPRDYHRIHMPLSGTLRAMTYVPGRLYSVAPYTVRQIDSLFAINERVITYFDTSVGPVALILVGAMLVNGMETVWAGEITPNPDRTIQRHSYDNGAIQLAKGEEMGRFNMGSTIVLLLPPGALNGTFQPDPAQPVKMGDLLGQLNLPDELDSNRL